jgi:hypothetical protein
VSSPGAIYVAEEWNPAAHKRNAQDRKDPRPIDTLWDRMFKWQAELNFQPPAGRGIRIAHNGVYGYHLHPQAPSAQSPKPQPMKAITLPKKKHAIPKLMASSVETLPTKPKKSRSGPINVPSGMTCVMLGSQLEYWLEYSAVMALGCLVRHPCSLSAHVPAARMTVTRTSPLQLGPQPPTWAWALQDPGPPRSPQLRIPARSCFP